MLRELVTPQSAEAEEINPFQDLFMSLPALASMQSFSMLKHRGEGGTREHPS